MNKLNFSYYLITDRKACAPRSITEVVEEACRYGIKALQLREKDLSGRRLFELAQQLRQVTARYDALLFINDRVDIALAAGADGVHCRETSLSPKTIRELSDDLIIGASVHSVQRAREACRASADFLMFGPVFHTPSKASYGQPQGINKLQKVSENVSCPVFAVGGITPKRGTQCFKAGAAGVAGISSIMKSSSVKKKVGKWKQVLNMNKA